MSDEVLMNCKDAAALLGISPRTLERYVAETQIPYIRLPRRGERGPIRFSRSQLRKWLDQHTVKPSQLSRFGENSHGREVREDEVPRRISA
jgi:excisionase family DNA binding protein